MNTTKSKSKSSSQNRLGRHNVGRERVKIELTTDVHSKGEQLAYEDNCEFATELERLIERECHRRGLHRLKGSATAASTEFESWLRKMPGLAPDADLCITVTLNLGVDFWIMLGHGAAVNRISLDEAISYCLMNAIEPCEWVNQNFAMLDLDGKPLEQMTRSGPPVKESSNGQTGGEGL
jgi:hypothetical protein